MKKIFILLFAALCLGCQGQAQKAECGDRMILGDGWQLSRIGGKEKCTTSVPATVAGALNASGFFGEALLEGKKYADVDKSIFDDTWAWEKSFSIRPEDGKHYELVFDGIGYYADIFLNGKQIASSDTTAGVFIRRAYDVTSILKKNNKLEVRTRRAQKGDLNIGFVDWNPRPLDESMGIVRPVTLHTTGSVAVGDVYVVPDLDTENFSSSDISVRVTLKNMESRLVNVSLVLDLQGLGTASVPVTLAPGESKKVQLTPAEMPLLHVENPRVWWSHDLGTPELYNLTATAKVEDKVSDKKDVTFGIRKIESRMVGENYRQFTLNGKDILIKGAGWTDDIFLQDTPESLAQQVAYVKDMNLNLIRFENIWGKDDTIYDLCDREGLLALVGFSCQWEWEDYCGLPEYKNYGCINGKEVEDLAVKYFNDQVVRLHNHPAVIAWMTGSDRVPNPDLEPRYLKIFEEEDYRPYVNSAKSQRSEFSGWSGSKMEGPYEYVAPDYWYLDTKTGGAFGFNTETGIGTNLPQLESLRRFIPEDKLWPLSDVWNYHCTASSSVMNNTKVLEETMTGQYGPAKDLEDFVRKAHALDYDGTRAMFESFRVRVPVATGIVQWMLNSAWPSLYWQLYDWYGVPTAAYYGVKKGCEPMQLLFDYKDRKVYAVNESAADAALIANVKVYDAQSKLIGQESGKVNIGYRQVLPVFDLAKYDGAPHFVALELTKEDGTAVADNFYCIPAEGNEYVWKKSNWFITPISKHASVAFAFEQPEADVEMTVEGNKVTLTNKSDVISYMNILKAKNADGNLIVPAFWSDNFFPLLPGQTKTVTCRTDAADVKFELSKQ